MIYKITIKGHVDSKWSDWFDDLQISHENDGTSTLLGSLPDQAALLKILRKIRDLNLHLISVTQVELDEDDETQANSEGGANT